MRCVRGACHVQSSASVLATQDFRCSCLQWKCSCLHTTLGCLLASIHSAVQNRWGKVSLWTCRQTFLPVGTICDASVFVYHYFCINLPVEMDRRVKESISTSLSYKYPILVQTSAYMKYPYCSNQAWILKLGYATYILCLNWCLQGNLKIQILLFMWSLLILFVYWRLQKKQKMRMTNREGSCDKSKTGSKCGSVPAG